MLVDDRYGSIATNETQQTASLFDYLVGGDQQAWRHSQAERLRRFQVDDRFVLGRCLHRKVARLSAAQDAVDVGRSPPKLIDAISAVAYETTSRDEERVRVDR